MTKGHGLCGKYIPYLVSDREGSLSWLLSWFLQAIAAMAFKYSDVIAPFDGLSDFGEWIAKVEMVASLQGVKKLEKFFPLFLTGGAFAVYQGLYPTTKDSYDAAKSAMLMAFSTDCFGAYSELISRRLGYHESVDVYLSDLRRLSSLIDSDMPDAFLKCAFVNGLPDELKSQLKAACALKKMSLADIVERTRLLSKSAESCMLASTRVAGNDHPTNRQIRCYNCQAVGHISRNCPQKRPEHAQRNRSRRCYVCGDLDHLAPSCPQKFSAVSKNE